MIGEPVQILRVKDEGDAIEFNESELRSILLDERVKDKPVVVISVAGAYRQGKSFLLSFLLRYLRSNGQSVWKEDMDAPLRGFEWRPGSTRETTGILLWNEVFLVTNSKGEEVAVLLMDTQGTFDCESTMKESTTIFSLSMLMSSVQIYNLMNNIREDDFQHLQFFAEYARLVQGETETRPFQKLLFLVRDWNWPHEKEYGFHGGRSLIESRLEIKHGQSEELRMLRRSISTCFSEIQCFLMPHPGMKVASEQSFDGRLRDMDEVFREKLFELVPSLLAPEELLVKKINGRELSCQDLMTFFKAYVDVFKGHDLPKPMSVLLATANASNVAAMDKARQRYMSGMRDRPRRDLEKLRKFHSELLAQAEQVFKDFPKVGGGATTSASMDLLTKELEEYYEHIFEEEDELIKKEQTEEAKRKKERDEERRREEERERERDLEMERAAAREAEIAQERAEMKQRLVELESRVSAEESKKIAAILQGAAGILQALSSFPAIRGCSTKGVPGS
uniref:Putative guanylate-binding protein n=1 Tax=Hyalomma excavatum TaxID=257692 RepID=A0A131XEE8_9ACAR